MLILMLIRRHWPVCGEATHNREKLWHFRSQMLRKMRMPRERRAARRLRGDMKRHGDAGFGSFDTPRPSGGTAILHHALDSGGRGADRPEPPPRRAARPRPRLVHL